ncbi:hypothetical protein COOONC_24242 [Cooperia oncophora]
MFHFLQFQFTNASQGDHPAAAQEQAANESPTTPLPTPVRSGKCQSYSMSFVTVASPVKASKPADPSPMHPPPIGLEPILQVPPPPPDLPVSQGSPIASGVIFGPIVTVSSFSLPTNLLCAEEMKGDGV